MAKHLIVACVLAAAAPAAAAPGEPVQVLAWTAPARCPDAAAIRARIERRLGESVEAVADGIAITVARRGHAYVAQIDLTVTIGVEEHRELESGSCAELADAVAMVVARAAREHAADRLIPALELAPPAAATGAAQGPEVDEERPPGFEARARGGGEPEPPRSSWRVALRLAGVSGIGIVPNVGLGTELALNVVHRELFAELGETMWHGHDPASPADVGLRVTAARVGWRPHGLPLRLWAVGELAEMPGRSATAASGGTWAAIGAGIAVEWPIARWFRLVGSTELVAAVERARYASLDTLMVYTPAPAAARVTCGVEVAWQ
jgi:hypothetical protein